jgi:hypothetical protein
MNQATLEKLIDLADAHQEADEYVAGTYQWNGGACSIGCTIRDAKKLKILPKSTKASSHESLVKTGVPELAWRLCDHIFEGLPEDKRAAWTPKFLRSIRADADYTFLPARVMARCARKLSKDAIDPLVSKNCLVVAKLWERRAKGNEPSEADWDAARQQAGAAWQQADAAWQQADAAWQQPDAARQQADAAWQQAYAAWQQASAALKNFWIWCGDMLCEELSRK